MRRWEHSSPTDGWDDENGNGWAMHFRLGFPAVPPPLIPGWHREAGTADMHDGGQPPVTSCLQLEHEGDNVGGNLQRRVPASFYSPAAT
jgi:hypothetical protein